MPFYNVLWQGQILCTQSWVEWAQPLGGLSLVDWGVVMVQENCPNNTEAPGQH